MPDTNRVYTIANIPGDGIGKETVPEGVRVLEAAAKKFGFEIRGSDYDYASADYWLKHKPHDARELEGGHRAQGRDLLRRRRLAGRAARPRVSLWGSLIQFRREFDQYASVRPARLMPGVKCPLAGREVGDIDFYVVRENTEGEYSAIGGRMFPGTDREAVIQETVFTRHGVDRIMKYAFELARKRPRKKVTSATKSNGIAITMPYWDERFEEMRKHYPDVETDKYHIDILTAHLRAEPRQVRRGGGLEPVRRHPVRPRAGLHRHDRHRAVRQHQSGAQASRRCSSRCMARRRTSRGRASRTRSARSGRRP